MGNHAIYLRLLHADDKAAALAQVIIDANTSPASPFVFRVDPQVFRQVPGSPIAYWVNDDLRRLFVDMPPFESDGRSVKQGLASADDFRFLRVWWEVRPKTLMYVQTDVANINSVKSYRELCIQKLSGSAKWVIFAKGGSYSPFYSDISAVVDWENDGASIKGNLNGQGKTRSNVWMLKDTEKRYFFRPGLTWPLRGIRLSAQAVPTGCIFSVAGKLATTDRTSDLPSLLAILNSRVFDFLVGMFAGKVGGVQYEVGLVQKIPLPSDINGSGIKLEAERSFNIKRNLDRANETSHVFHLPAILQVTGSTLSTHAEAWAQYVAQERTQLDARQCEIDRIALELYGLTKDNIRLPEEKATFKLVNTSNNGEKANVDATNTTSIDSSNVYVDEEESEEASLELDLTAHADGLISYLVGCAFGRWDIRYANDRRPMPNLWDPFDPLPACSPGMLTGGDGLPLLNAPAGYPLRIDADGILVDDPDHPDDIVRRARGALDIIFGPRAEIWERDVCAALGISELRDYMRKGAFWQAHIKRYSKSRRKAPIYWLLQSPRKHYAIWLYYHRLDKDTLFKALVNYAEPKLRREQSKLDEMQSKRSAAATPKEQRALDREMERQQAVVGDVQEFCERLERAAKLYLVPDLNDGVVLTIAPLHELVLWREARHYWDELRAGKYEWSSIGRQMREKGLVQ